MKQLTSSILSTLCGLTIAAQSVQAGTFYQGWTYSIDAFTDGAGGTAYDIKGVATKETQDYIYVSISGESPLTGTSAPNADDNNIGWGDLLFNFTGKNLSHANGDLFGIRFAGTNDSGVSQVGVFRDVTAQSVTQSNSGYDHLKSYYNDGWERLKTMGDLSTKQDAYDYMGETSPVLMSISEGTFLGAIDFLSPQAAVAAGLEFEHFNAVGSETHTFQFNRSLLPGGEFIATLLMECANDGIALLSRFNTQNNTTQDVPEPSALLGLIMIGLVISRRL